MENAVRASRARLKACVVNPQAISSQDLTRMFELMSLYYDDVTWEQFKADLYKKNAVIVMHDNRENQLQGFSTLLYSELPMGNRTVNAVFSGDTVIAREFWGQRTLGKAFLKHLVLLKFKNLRRPLYWFLISKGYKTYLLMANNFSTHFPRFERKTPDHIKQLLNSFYKRMYPDAYDAASGTIAFPVPAGKLKTGVAPVTADLRNNPRVRFFETCNPQWREGTELACVAEMTFFMPAYYTLKSFFKLMFQPVKSTLKLIPFWRAEGKKT